MSAVVLLLVATLKSGLHVTTSMTAPDYAQCQAARPAMENDVRKRNPEIVKIRSICLEFPEL